MAETSLPWCGIFIGDHGPYNTQQWRRIHKWLSQLDMTTQGVLNVPDTNKYDFTILGSSIQVDTGVAVVNGIMHWNDSPVVLVPSHPDPGTSRIDLIVIESEDAIQEARLMILEGQQSASPTPPAPTQIEALWQLPLIRYEIDEDGNITDAVFLPCIPLPPCLDEFVLHLGAFVSGQKHPDDALRFPKFFQDDPHPTQYNQNGLQYPGIRAMVSIPQNLAFNEPTSVDIVWYPVDGGTGDVIWEVNINVVSADFADNTFAYPFPQAPAAAPTPPPLVPPYIIDFDKGLHGISAASDASTPGIVRTTTITSLGNVGAGSPNGDDIKTLFGPGKILDIKIRRRIDDAGDTFPDSSPDPPTGPYGSVDVLCVIVR